VGAANTDIRQLVAVLPDDASKLQWLLSHLQKCVDNGDVMIFAGKKSRVEEAEAALRHAGFRVAALHGDKDQASRMGVLREFKEGKHHVLVATDVAARGLDISSIKTVINLDVARDIDSHVHRIGRTGRAGATDGAAITLLTQAEHRMAGELVFNMQNAMQTVTQVLFRGRSEGRFCVAWGPEEPSPSRQLRGDAF
jgi:ATP-dependent RNA helicase DDX42